MKHQKDKVKRKKNPVYNHIKKKKNKLNQGAESPIL